MKKITVSGVKVREYCERMNTASSNSIARTLVKDHPLLFTSKETARDAVRYHRGAHKHNGRQKCSDIIPRFELPKAYNQDYTDYKIKAKRILLISDLHIPYHDETALMCALEEGRRQKCDTVVIDGDMMDCHTLSRFNKDPEARSFADEVEATKQFLTMLKKHFKQIIYKIGNHEERHEIFLMQHAPELFKCKGMSLSDLLGLDALGVQYVCHRRVMTAGYLRIIHGHEYTGGTINPVNPARGLFLRSKGIAVQGHNHQTSEHTEPTISGEIITDWSVGCLCFLHPQFMPLNKWNHGAAIISLKPDGSFHMRNFRIRNGKVL